MRAKSFVSFASTAAAASWIDQWEGCHAKESCGVAVVDVVVILPRSTLRLHFEVGVIKETNFVSGLVAA